jgi:hypothetical protein
MNAGKVCMEQDINKRIAEEQAKINVPSYQDVALDGAWKRRSNMMWGLGALGTGFGAAFGLIGAGLAAVAGAPLTPELVGTSLAIFSATGMSSGLATGVMVGPSAGAAASAAKEMERRVLARQIEEKMRENPDTKIELHETPQTPPKEPFKLADYVNFKTMAVFAAIGLAGGLIAAAAFTAAAASGGAAAFAMPAMGALLGTVAPTATALSIYSGGMGMAFGAFFGVNVPKLTRLSSNFMGELLSGKAIDAPWPASSAVPEQKPILSPIITEPEQESTKTFSDKVGRKPNFEALVNQSIKEVDGVSRA